jgi:diadenosine tetraphosphate (Ap4A) HIT family hydrolase
MSGLTACALCRGLAGDADLGREEVWSDDLWRLSTSVGPHEVTPGFSYLEPRRHISHIEDLDGPEAVTFGPTLARCAAALKAATAAERVYVYVFGGGIPHLHVHLAPHTEGDALSDAIVRGEVESTQLDSGATAFVSKDFPSLPEEETRRVAGAVRRLLAETA